MPSILRTRFRSWPGAERTLECPISSWAYLHKVCIALLHWSSAVCLGMHQVMDCWDGGLRGNCRCCMPATVTWGSINIEVIFPTGSLNWETNSAVCQVCFVVIKFIGTSQSAQLSAPAGLRALRSLQSCNLPMKIWTPTKEQRNFAEANRPFLRTWNWKWWLKIQTERWSSSWSILNAASKHRHNESINRVSFSISPPFNLQQGAPLPKQHLQPLQCQWRPHLNAEENPPQHEGKDFPFWLSPRCCAYLWWFSWNSRMLLNWWAALFKQAKFATAFFTSFLMIRKQSQGLQHTAKRANSTHV